MLKRSNLSTSGHPNFILIIAKDIKELGNFSSRVTRGEGVSRAIASPPQNNSRSSWPSWRRRDVCVWVCKSDSIKTIACLHTNKKRTARNNQTSGFCTGIRFVFFAIFYPRKKNFPPFWARPDIVVFIHSRVCAKSYTLCVQKFLMSGCMLKIRDALCVAQERVSRHRQLRGFSSSRLGPA